MRLTLSIAGIWLVAITTVTSASAQGTSNQVDPRKDARIHVGPFHMSPSIVINNVGVDTNVFNAAGEPVSDFNVSLDPKLTVWLPIAKRALITTTLSNGIDYYKTYTKESSLDPGIAVRGDLLLQRVKFFGEESYAQSRRRPNFEIDARVPQTTTGTTVGLSIALGTRMGLTASAYRDRSRYDQDAFFQGRSLRDRLNRNQQGVRLKLERQLSSLTSVRLVGENRQDKFLFAPFRDAVGVKFAAGASFGRRALISGDAEVGVRHMDLVASILQPFNGVVANVALTHQRQSAMAYRFEWNRDVEFSFEELRTYYVLNSTKLTLRREVVGHFDVIVAAGRNSSVYAKFVSLEGTPTTSTKTLNLDLGYRLKRDARVGFGLTRTWRSSDPSNGRDYAGIVAGMSFRVGF
jgi:hypothetical protein